MLSTLRSKLVSNAASLMSVPAKLIPQTIHNKVLLEGLKRVFHEALEGGDFEFLEGRWLKVSISDVNVSWLISYEDEKLIVADSDVQEDVSFSGSLNDLVLIAGRKEDPDTMFFQRRLKIEGDTELGLEVKNLMDSLDLDSLPKPVTQLMDQLSTFVQKGMTETATPKAANAQEIRA